MSGLRNELVAPIEGSDVDEVPVDDKRADRDDVVAGPAPDLTERGGFLARIDPDDPNQT